MEQKVIDAYLHLMYRAFVEIRAQSVSPFTLWNPSTWRKNGKLLWRINRLSNAMHNLPFDIKSNNIAEFDEEVFWRAIERYENEIPEVENGSYKGLFEKILNGEEGKLLD